MGSSILLGWVGDVESQYDYFGARYYDARIGRWLAVDPLAEKSRDWSPYAGIADNPVCLLDPDGRLATDFKDQDGNLVDHHDDGSNAVFRLSSYEKPGDYAPEKRVYYQFEGYNESQGGTNEINVASAVAGAQDFAQESNLFKPEGKKSFCNFATRTVVKTFESATGRDLSVGSDGSANQMAGAIANSPSLKPVNQKEAMTVAGKSGLALLVLESKSGSGHVATFSAAQNAQKGAIADVGKSRGFKSLSQAFRPEDRPKAQFYIPK